MNSFTHSGIHQIAQRFKEESLDPNYNPSEIVKLIQFADSLGMLATLEIVLMTGDNERAVAVYELIKCYN
jgi:hypothetical protein